MPSRWIVPPVLLLIASIVLAQPPSPNAAQTLDATLRSWEQALAKLDRFAVTCRRTTTDKTFGTVETYVGSARFRRGTAGQPSQAYLKVASTRDAQRYEELLYTGTQLYVWQPGTKVLQVRNLPPRKPGAPLIDDSILALLFDVTAAGARERYAMAWLPDTLKQYHYLRIVPRRAEDKAEFTEAQLSLTAADCLPRQLRYYQPNGNVIQWDFKDLKKNDASVTPASFAPPMSAPPGWRVDRIAPTATAAPQR